jgi:endonuclease-3
MTKKEKVTFAIETLERLYPEIPIPLDHKDPYTLLIAGLHPYSLQEHPLPQK